MKRRVANGTGRRWLDEHVSHQGQDCLLWPFSCMTAGYGQFSIGQKRQSAHRYMCEAAHGPAPSPLHEAAHSCGNRRCANPQHLSWKTISENQADRHVHGTACWWGTRGKLLPLQVQQIRQLKGMETSIKTAARYGVTESNVRLIQDGKTWPTLDKRSPEHRRMVEALSAANGPLRVKEIARATGHKLSSTYLMLSKLERRAIVVRVGRGIYSMPNGEC